MTDASTSPSPAPEAPPDPESSPESRTSGHGTWRRAAALFLVGMVVSVAQPSVLVAVPLVAMVLFLSGHALAATFAGALAAVIAFGGPSSDGLWYAERAWSILVGGAFVALTIRRPRAAFIARALPAVVGSAAILALVFAFRPGWWEVVDWQASERVQSALDVIQVIGGAGEALSPAMLSVLYATADLQARLFPALLGLGSIACTGVAWWIYVRLGRGTQDALAPVRDFRFSDGWIWLFIAGLILLVLQPGDGWARAGSNALVFMGGLYVVRGAAVVTFLTGGPGLLGGLMLFLALLLAAPVLILAALVIGLGDTWLDLRSRAEELAAP